MSALVTTFVWQIKNEISYIKANKRIDKKVNENTSQVYESNSKRQNIVQ